MLPLSIDRQLVPARPDIMFVPLFSVGLGLALVAANAQDEKDGVPYRKSFPCCPTSLAACETLPSELVRGNRCRDGRGLHPPPLRQ